MNQLCRISACKVEAIMKYVPDEEAVIQASSFFYHFRFGGEIQAINQPGIANQ